MTLDSRRPPLVSKPEEHKFGVRSPPRLRSGRLAMPTILRVGPYRFFFYSADGEEPPHVHVERDDSVAKF